MGNLAAIVRALISCGATSEMLLAAVEADEKSRIESEAQKRENSRLRKIKSRNINDHVTVTSVTSVTARDICDNSSPLVPPFDGGLSLSPEPLSLSNLNSPLNPPNTFFGSASEVSAPPIPSVKPKISKGARLGRDWDLPEEWGEWAEKQGMEVSEVIRECDKFKDYWIAKTGRDACKADWEATWRNWIRRVTEGKWTTGARKAIN